MAAKCFETTKIASEQPVQRFRNITKDSKEYILLWLDQNVVSTREYLDVQKKVRQIIPDLKIVDDLDACVNYMTDLKDQKVVLILCSSYNHRFISTIHPLSNLLAVYIYCLENEAAEKWGKDYGILKIRGVFTQTKDLVMSISTDQEVRGISSIKLSDKQQMFFSDGVERIAANAVVMNVYSTQNTDTSKERDLKNATFMYFQVLIDILLGISITTNQNFLAKQDLLDHFKIVYKGNAAQEQIIEEFENNYKPEEAIRWYTRPTFLYSILNKALRNFDYDVLFALRFFINDLQRNLAAAHEAFLTSYELGDPIISVYRGQNISVADLNYLRQSIGQFVAMQSFLSTTSDKKFAKFFAESSAPTTTDTTCIVFEFHLDTRVSNTKPYANIKHLSYFPEEEEVLLMLGSIFRIEQIEYNELEETWIGILNLCSDDDYELKELMEHLKEDAGEGIISPAYLLYRQGDHEKAKQYCQQLLLDPSLDDQDRVNCYRVLSAIANAHDEYDDILENLQKQLELQVLRNNPMETAVTYTFIGETYLFKNDFDQALSYEQKALEILLPLNVPQLANVYAIMANIWMQKKDFSLALTYHEKGLAVDQQYLPENHQTFGITYANIGATYHLSGDLMKALEYYNKAREVYSKTIAPDHPNALYVEENIRRVNRLINKQEHE